MNSEIEKIKKEIDLQDYALRYYNIESNHQGKAHCPFHPPDNNPSFQFWKGDDGIHRFTDYHDDEGGTIIDFEVKMNGLDVKEAIQSIKFLTFSQGTQVTPNPDVVNDPVFLDATTPKQRLVL